MNTSTAALRRSPARNALWGELLLLALAAPPLYFPNWLPPWSTWAAIGLLALILPWRRFTTGQWWTRTPIDWPLLVIFALLLPLSLWAAPDALRARYSLPRALILLWNGALFSTVVTYGSRSYARARAFALGLMGALTAVALLAPLGMNWLYKITSLNPLLQAIPRPLLGLFQGAESGFSPNQVAGALLYALPLSLIWGILGWQAGRRTIEWRLSLAAALIMGATLILSQSRGALIGLVVGLAIVLILSLPRGPILAAGVILAGAVSSPLWLRALLQLAYGGNEYVGSAVMNLDWRTEVWQRAIIAIHDFPITGLGLGTFREAARWLYPFYHVAEDYDIAHAHNFFLQAALDWGLAGMIALLAAYLAACALLIRLAQPGPSAPIPYRRVWAFGLAASLCAQTIYSLSDAVTMGSKPNLFFWWLLALICAFGNLAHQEAANDGAGVP